MPKSPGISFDPEKHAQLPEQKGGGFVDKSAIEHEAKAEEIAAIESISQGQEIKSIDVMHEEAFQHDKYRSLIMDEPPNKLNAKQDIHKEQGGIGKARKDALSFSKFIEAGVKKEKEHSFLARLFLGKTLMGFREAKELEFSPEELQGDHAIGRRNAIAEKFGVTESEVLKYRGIILNAIESLGNELEPRKVAEAIDQELSTHGEQGVKIRDVLVNSFLGKILESIQYFSSIEFKKEAEEEKLLYDMIFQLEDRVKTFNTLTELYDEITKHRELLKRYGYDFDKLTRNGLAEMVDYLKISMKM